MNENKAMKTPEAPKMTLFDVNALKVKNSNQSGVQLNSTKPINAPTNKFQTPSSSTTSYSKTSFAASICKQTSKSDDLHARYKRFEDSGLLRRIREELNSVVEDDGDDENKIDVRFTCKESSSNVLENENYESESSSNNNIPITNVKKNIEGLKGFKIKMNENDVKTSKDLLKNGKSNKGTPQRSEMKQSKSEPDLVPAKSSNEVEKSSLNTHKTTDSKQNNLAAVTKSRSTSNLSNNKESELKSFKINEKTYYKLNKIGQGGSSHVYQVYEPVTQKTLALKVVDLSKADETTRKGFMNEIKLLLKLRNCERVVKLYDYCKVNTNQLIVIMEKGDSDLGTILRQFVETKNKYSLDPLVIKHYWKEMLKAVNEVHKLDIIHSDLKPVNFISVGGKLKLIDFGIANAIEADHTSVVKENQIGTINYMAPESLKQFDSNPGRKFEKPLYKFNCKADIWSLGCILYNLVYGKAPFAHLNSLYAKLQAICDNKYEIEYPPYENELVIDCIKLCLNRDPHKRPTAELLLNHPYLKESQTSSPKEPQLSEIYKRINSLTPNRINKLSKVIASMAQNK